MKTKIKLTVVPAIEEIPKPVSSCTLRQFKESAIKGRSVDTKAGGIADKIVEGFVVEVKCTMNTGNMVYDRLIWMEPLALVITRLCEVGARLRAERFERCLVGKYGM